MYLNEENSKRINILRAWLAIMVVFIHSYVEENNYIALGGVQILHLFKYAISLIISPCAVPCFFIISSILLYRKNFKWKDNMKKKVYSLLIPYLIFNTFWLVIFLITSKISFLSGFFNNTDKYSNIFIYVLDSYLGFKTKFPVQGSLWFVRDLIVLNMLSVIIKRLVDSFPKTIIWLTTIAWIFNVKTNIFFLDIKAICFWIFGYYIVKNKYELDRLDKFKHIIFPTYILINIIQIIAYVKIPETLIYFVVDRLNVLVGCCWWYVFATKIRNEKINKILIVISKYSFCIYVFHEMALRVLQKIWTRLLPNTVIFQLVEFLILPAIVIACIIVFSIILEKYFNPIYNVIIGKRNKNFSTRQ